MNFPTPGEHFANKYRVENLLGKGGFSRVYRAIQEDLERPVALKILKPPIQTDASAAERQKKLDGMAVRFNREAKMMSRLRSPHTITVYDYGRTEDGLLFMAIEYIDGMDLTNLIRSQGAIDPERVFKILKQVLISLHEAHSLGMLHRDIKPQNIMIYDHLGQRDQIKLLDFGIVKLIDEEAMADQRDLTDDGTLVGTPRYMSPEYIRGSRIGPPSDLYSLGLVIYELLVGEQAIMAESSIQIIGKQLEPHSFFLPALLEVSPEFRRIVNRMLHKDPTQRYQSAEEVIMDMQGMEDMGLPASSLVEVGLSERSEPQPSRPAPLSADDPTAIEIPSARINNTAPIVQPTGEYDYFDDLGSPPLPPKNNTPLLIGAIAALALFIFGGLGLVALKKDSQPDTAPPQVKLAEAAPQPLALKFYHIQTQPAGAHVTINGVNMGKSPLHLPSDQLEFPATITATLNGATITQDFAQPQDINITMPEPPETPPPAELTAAHHETTPQDNPPPEEVKAPVVEDKTPKKVIKTNTVKNTKPKEPKETTKPPKETKEPPKQDPPKDPKTTNIRTMNVDDI